MGAKFTEPLDVDAYIDDYLRRRGQPVHGSARRAVIGYIERYVGSAPITPADLDFHLDANLRAIVP